MNTLQNILKWISLAVSFVVCFSTYSQEANDTTTLREVVVSQRRTSSQTSKATNTQLITTSELKRAACCNLGESFTTNPSVDVSYNDAATGARQIKLLGLSGTYVQVLTENVPNFRIAAAPYGLGYVAGPWMQSIQVSKGASSVKNGYESITGQINIEMKKPQSEPEANFNAYVDHMGKLEANADANWLLSDRLSTGLLAHFENGFAGHDENNDGFMDMPRVRQITAANRWAWMGTNYVFQAFVRFLDEKRKSGSHSHDDVSHHYEAPYNINISTTRWEAFTKNAYIFDHENDGNVALILSGSIHDMDAAYGVRKYSVNHKHGYASLMFERKWSEIHALSAGLSFNYDHLDETLELNDVYNYIQDEDAYYPRPKSVGKDIEAVSGAYAQYTFDLDKKLILMCGLRYDYSSVFGSMFTPRFHARWNPDKKWSLHGSIGKGYRSPHALAENNYLLASSRQLIIDRDLHQEEAWNMGAGVNAYLPMFGRTLTLGAEYYHTDFQHQLLLDFVTDPHVLHFKNLDGKSYSHTWQVDATYDVIKDLSVTAAWRRNIVKVDYGQGLIDKPLLPRDKWLLTTSYQPMMGIWQFDVTLTVNGKGDMPEPYITDDGNKSWNSTFKAYPQLNAQVTRNFRHWAIYLGGENLTNYRQPYPIIDSRNPYGPNFDSTLVYGPLHGALVYAGFRYNI